MAGFWKRLFGRKAATPFEEGVEVGRGVETLSDSGKAEGPDRYWAPRSVHPDQAAGERVDLVRGRSDIVSQTTSLGAEFLHRLQVDVVGTGLNPWPLPKWANGADRDYLSDQLVELWEDMVPYWDFRGLLNVYMLQSYALRAWAQCGAFIGVFSDVFGDDAPLPCRLQLFEPHALAEDVFQYEGREVRRGVELDAYDRIVALHLRERSGLNDWGLPKARRIPIRDCIYAFRPLRIGQTIGMPWIDPALMTIYGLDDYSDSERTRARARSKPVHYVETSNPTERVRRNSTAQVTTDAAGNRVTERVEQIKTGRKEYLGPGEKVSSPDQSAPPSSYGEYVREGRREVSIGVGSTYESLTGDHSQTHFSASRATANCDARNIRENQGLLNWFLCRRMFERMTDRAVMLGKLKGVSGLAWATNPDYRRRTLNCRWRGPGMASHSPLEDSKAGAIRIGTGTASRSQICMNMGTTFEEVVGDQEYEEDLLRKKKIRGIGIPGDLATSLIADEEDERKQETTREGGRDADANDEPGR